MENPLFYVFFTENRVDKCVDSVDCNIIVTFVKLLLCKSKTLAKVTLKAGEWGRERIGIVFAACGTVMELADVWENFMKNLLLFFSL